MMFYEDFHHNVLKLDIHDGGHCLLLWAEQSRPEDHAQVGDRHQIVLIVTGHAVGEENDVLAKMFKVLCDWYLLSGNRLLTPHSSFENATCLLQVSQPVLGPDI